MSGAADRRTRARDPTACASQRRRCRPSALSTGGDSIVFGPAGRVRFGAPVGSATPTPTRDSSSDSTASPACSARSSSRCRRDSAPPRGRTGAALLGLGWRVRRLGRRDMRELLRIGAMNVYDLLQEQFESPLLQGALGLDAVLGTNFGPRSPGTVLTLLYRLAAQAGAGPRALSQPLGGMGAVCDALARAAAAAGATIRTDAPVARVLVENDTACGVLLESGERIAARTVISSADPKTTLAAAARCGAPRHRLRAQGQSPAHPRASPPSCTWRSTRRRSSPARMQAALGGRLLVAPSLDYIERAFNHSKYGEYSAAPAIEITVPTVRDPALAPAGGHVLSADRAVRAVRASRRMGSRARAHGRPGHRRTRALRAGSAQPGARMRSC